MASGVSDITKLMCGLITAYVPCNVYTWFITQTSKSSWTLNC